MDAPMTTTEQSLARIFAICDHVAESGETLRTEDEGREAARAFLGQNAKVDLPPKKGGDSTRDVTGG